MTGDGALRTLAANFCLSAVGGNITRVNGAIEILFELLKACRDAGGNLDAVDEIAIDWRAQDRATKSGDANGPHPAAPSLPLPSIELAEKDLRVRRRRRRPRSAGRVGHLRHLDRAREGQFSPARESGNIGRQNRPPREARFPRKSTAAAAEV